MQDSEPTPYADLNGVLRELVTRQQAVLGDRFVAASLQGSFAVGDFDEHSDVDWVAVIDRPLDEAQVAALQDMHARIYDGECAWAQHLEGSYFPTEVLRDAARTDEELWYLDNGARSLIRSTHCNTLVVRQTVREHGVSLFGPAPATLVDPIPVAVLRTQMFVKMRDWADEILAEPEPWANRFYQGFIVLHFCRVWCDLTTGTVGSKRRGAEWAKARLDPEWTDLIDRAWSTRPDPAASVRTPADPDDYARTLAFLRLILPRCEEFAR